MRRVHLTPAQWRQKRRMLMKYPRPPDPPEGMMFNPLKDRLERPFEEISRVERIAREIYEEFDSLPKARRKVLWDFRL